MFLCVIIFYSVSEHHTTPTYQEVNPHCQLKKTIIKKEAMCVESHRLPEFVDVAVYFQDRSPEL